MPVESNPIDFEVLPPKKPGDQSTPRGGRDVPDLSRLIAWLLDDFFKIPGTNVRIGLDPIIGLIPGIGAGSSAVMSSVILLHSLRQGVPHIVLVRMALNVLINSLLDAIPGVGDLASVWFKPNRRNIELLDRHAHTATKVSTTADWIFVGALVGGLLLIAIATSTFAIFVFYKLIKLLWAV